MLLFTRTAGAVVGRNRSGPPAGACRRCRGAANGTRAAAGRGPMARPVPRRQSPFKRFPAHGRAAVVRRPGTRRRRRSGERHGRPREARQKADSSACYTVWCVRRARARTAPTVRRGARSTQTVLPAATGVPKSAPDFRSNVIFFFLFPSAIVPLVKHRKYRLPECLNRIPDGSRRKRNRCASHGCGKNVYGKQREKKTTRY